VSAVYAHTHLDAARLAGIAMLLAGLVDPDVAIAVPQPFPVLQQPPLAPLEPDDLRAGMRMHEAILPILHAQFRRKQASGRGR